MRRLRVNIPQREYDICVGTDIICDSGSLIREVYSGNRAAVITDSNVYPLYAQRLAEVLRSGGIETRIITVPAGERSKSAACLDTLYDGLLEMNLTRGELIIALGGGVVGDLAGYAAATLLRGVPFVQIPTTLLAQVDSSVGGKVAINHARGKNLIGAFYQPKLVIADISCFDTLDRRVFSDGMGEVVKYGAIADLPLIELLESGQYDMPEIVTRCCDIKRGVVERDELDTGLRMTLNFGHTFGHAIEKHYNYETYTHGEAVSIGMVLACELGERLGVTRSGTAQRLTELLSACGLPVRADVDTKTLFGNMLLDKKRDGGKLNLILLTEAGSCKIYPVEIKELEGVVC